jgi:hypothetical protein
MVRYKTIIGRAESLDISEFFLTDIPAKTDTGAYLSAIHAEDVRELTKKNGKKVLKFTLLGNHPSVKHTREVEVAKFTKKIIQNSFGHQEERYVVVFKVKIAGKLFKTEFSLADRSKKIFPVLLGRTLLNKRFVVDTDVAHIDRKQLKEKLKDWLAKDDNNDSEETA